MSSQKLTGMCLPHLQSSLTSTAKSVRNRCVGVTAEHSHLALDLATATLLWCMPDEMLTQLVAQAGHLLMTTNLLHVCEVCQETPVLELTYNNFCTEMI